MWDTNLADLHRSYLGDGKVVPYVEEVGGCDGVCSEQRGWSFRVAGVVGAWDEGGMPTGLGSIGVSIHWSWTLIS